MRIVSTLADHQIIQVEKTPLEGELVDLTGKYGIPVPEGVKVAVGPTSFVLPSAHPDSVITQAFSGLLAQFPQYENILFNPLLEGSDIDDIDLSGVLNEGVPVTASHQSRAQVGRGTGGLLPSGMAANSVALLESNNTLGVGNDRPGVLVTDTIDIGPLTGGLGTNTFMVYWYLYDFETTVDVRASFGSFAGQNTPALRKVLEVDQEPNDLEVFISINNGANFLPVQRLVPITFCESANLIKLAFKNTNPLKKKYLAQYALLF